MSRMTYTPPEIERIMRGKLMALSGEGRLVMDGQMRESAREMEGALLSRGLSETRGDGNCSHVSTGQNSTSGK